MTNDDATEAARALAARRPTVTIICEICGRQATKQVRSGAKRSRTCSRSCREKLLRRERGAERGTTPNPRR